jgi:hypothetical protein
MTARHSEVSMQQVAQAGFYWYRDHREETVVKVIGSGEQQFALFIGAELPIPLKQLQGEMIPLTVPVPCAMT